MGARALQWGVAPLGRRVVHAPRTLRGAGVAFVSSWPGRATPHLRAPDAIRRIYSQSLAPLLKEESHTPLHNPELLPQNAIPSLERRLERDLFT